MAIRTEQADLAARERLAAQVVAVELLAQLLPVTLVRSLPVVRPLVSTAVRAEMVLPATT